MESNNISSQNMQELNKNNEVFIKEEVIDEGINMDCLNPIFSDIGKEFYYRDELLSLEVLAKTENEVFLMDESEDQHERIELNKNSKNGFKTYKKGHRDLYSFNLNTNQVIQEINLQVSKIPGKDQSADICHVTVEFEIEEDSEDEIFQDDSCDQGYQGLGILVKNIANYQFKHTAVCPGGELYLFREIRSGRDIIVEEFKCSMCKDIIAVPAEEDINSSL